MVLSSIQKSNFLIKLIKHIKHIIILTCRPRPVVIHPHLIGSLFATQAGTAFIQSRIDISELCSIITDEEESVVNKQTVLWIIAHIAIQDKGYHFLQVRNNHSFYWYFNW